MRPLRPRRSASLPALATASAAVVAGGTLAALLTLAAPSAPAGVPLVDKTGVPDRWDLDTAQPNVVGGEVTYYADTSALRDTVQGPKSAAKAIHDAVRSWAVTTTRIRFRSDTTRPAFGLNGKDRVNWIGWRQAELEPATFAATYHTRRGSVIVDSDIVLNDGSFYWNTVGGDGADGDPGSADIQSLVTHEWGHAIGCDHVPLRTSTMFFSADVGQISLRSLETDDEALVGALYPNDAFNLTTGTLRGRVDIAGIKDDRAAHVIAVAAGSGEPAVSTLSLPDGSFEIRGLPRGAYRVLVAPTVPLGDVMNPFWRSGSTGFLPSFAAYAPGNPAEATSFRIAAQQDASVGTLEAGFDAKPLEPNNTAETATPLRVGDAVAARLESGGGFDWYVFQASAGDRLALKVLAWEIGSNANPQMRLSDADDHEIATSLDIRDSRSLRSAEGLDRDCAIGPWTAPADGAYFVRVSASETTPSAQNFYVLLVTHASDAPSPRLTTAFASPSRIDAGGAASTTIVVTPRREDGDDVGPGATVELFHSGQGGVGRVEDQGDGTYTAVVTSAAEPGRDTFTTTVSTPLGVGTTGDLATLVYVGPVSPATSTLTALPRRIAANGSAETTVRFVPRDANGEALGGGRPAAVDLADESGAVLGALGGTDDGEYKATLVAPRAPGRAQLSARVGDSGVVATASVAFGFVLTDVLADADADVAGLRATEGLPKRAGKALTLAAKRVAAAAAKAQDAADDPARERAALSKARSAMAALDKALARSEGRLTDAGTLRDIALAVREAADAAIARVVIRNGRDQNAVNRARTWIDKGDATGLSGDLRAAAAAWFKAYRAVFSRL